MNKPKITIIAVNWWARDFAKFAVGNAISFYSKNPVEDLEIILIDNSGELEDKKSEWSSLTKLIKPGTNLGHGKGLDHAVEQATGEYILVLDIDAQILPKDWDKKLIDYYEKRNQNDPDGKLKMITGEGGQLKPSRPCVCFFERQFFLDNKLSFVAKDLDGVKFDVGVHAYFKTLSLGYQVDFFKYAKTEFEDVFGNDYLLGGERFVYHNWYSSRWYNVDGKRVHDKIDSVEYDVWKIKKDNLFKQI